MKKLSVLFSIALLVFFSNTSYAQAGIGARIGTDSIATGRWPYIIEIMENSPAAESNLLSFAWITAVDGISTQNLSIDKVVKMISGAEGTTVIIRMKDNGIETDVPVVRRKYVLKDALSLITPSLIPYRYGKVWGYANEQKKIIIPTIYQDATPFAEGVAAVNLNGKWGIIDSLGNTVLAPTYGSIQKAQEGRMTYSSGGVYGFLDTKGKVIAAAKYKYVYPFTNGFAKVKAVNGYYGFIDKSGKEITEMKYDDADDFNYGLAAVALNKHYAFINGYGREVTPFKYEFSIYFPKFSNGLCKVFDGKHYGYIDQYGKEMLNCKYKNAENFKNGVAAIVEDDIAANPTNAWTLINKKGEILSTEKFGQVNGGYSNGSIAVSKGSSFTSDYGYCNKRGKMDIEVQFNYAGEFINGYAVVADDDYNYYPINGAGKRVIDDNYEKITTFNNGIVILERKDHKKAFATQAGKYKPFTAFKYDYAYEFNNGIAWVNFNGGADLGYYIDTKGNEYYDAAAAEIAIKKSEDDKYVNKPNALNEHPTDGGTEIKEDDVYVGYLSTGDQKAAISSDKQERYIDGYPITVKAGDRLKLNINSMEFTIAAILQSPSGKQAIMIGDANQYQSSAKLDTVLQEDGAYTLYITSSEPGKTGRYSAGKKLASPAAMTLNPNADFCTRLNYVEKHADAYFEFATGDVLKVEKGIFTATFYNTTAELVKGKTATIEKGFRTLYSSTLFAATNKKEVEKKFNEYEKLIRSCLVTDWEFKISDDPADEDGKIHTLTATTGYVRSLNMSIVLDKAGNYSLLVEIK
jgi:WG containing repeat